MVNFNYLLAEGVMNQRVNINTSGVLIHQTPIPWGTSNNLKL